MKLALFADVHSNLEAIAACLNHAPALGADQFAFLGDMVGYGADPAAVLDLIERYARKDAVVVLANHDSASFSHRAAPLTQGNRQPSTGPAASWGRSNANFLPVRRSPSGLTTYCSCVRAPSRRNNGSTSPDPAMRSSTRHR